MRQEMEMQRLVWSDQYATGIEQIDAHNESLFFVLDELFAADMPCERLSRMCHKIEETIVYLTRNFLREETLMVDRGYPDLEAHKSEHRVLLEELLRLQRTLECGRYDTFEMFDFLASWAVGHIEIWDKGLGDHLRSTPPGTAHLASKRPEGEAAAMASDDVRLRVA